MQRHEARPAQPIVHPSLICLDLCNIERDVRVLADAGYPALHIDIVDGRFSPSMPLGLETLRQLRERTSLPFDAHVMAIEPDFFIDELLDIGVDQLGLHIETTHHIDQYINKIQARGVKAGVALNPATSLSVLEYVMGKCDYVLLMLINPGYAHLAKERQVPYAQTKIENLRKHLDQIGRNIPIEVDGRISLENIKSYHQVGADIFVGGSTCLRKNGDLVSGKAEIDRAIAEAISRKEEFP
jgi:ribulose-phosphate 3-epimerase